MDKRKSKRSRVRYARMRAAIDRFWMDNHYPPTIRDLMEIVGITSTSVASYYIKRLPEVRQSEHGRIIPQWVDGIFQSHQKANG